MTAVPLFRQFLGPWTRVLRDACNKCTVSENFAHRKLPVSDKTSSRNCLEIPESSKSEGSGLRKRDQRSSVLPFFAPQQTYKAAL